MALKILCIVGVGHSGSTLLGNVLDLGNCRCLGELHQLPKGLLGAPHECSCGQLVSGCAHWDAVSDEWRNRAPCLDLTQHLGVAHDLGQRALAALKASAPLPDDEALQRWCAEVDALYDAAAFTGSVSVETLVDCSKHVGRAALLAARSRHDVRLLHLIRDPRGVSWSHRKPRPPKPGQSEIDSRHRSVRKTINRWNRDNTIAHRLVTTTPRPATSLRYEDFVTRPEMSLARLETELGVDLSGSRAAIEARQPLVSGHAVAGNAGVRRRPVTDLVLDEHWRQGLSALERLYCWSLVNRRLKWHFGY